MNKWCINFSNWLISKSNKSINWYAPFSTIKYHPYTPTGSWDNAKVLYKEGEMLDGRQQTADRKVSAKCHNEIVHWKTVETKSLFGPLKSFFLNSSLIGSIIVKIGLWVGFWNLREGCNGNLPSPSPAERVCANSIFNIGHRCVWPFLHWFDLLNMCLQFEYWRVNLLVSHRSPENPAGHWQVYLLTPSMQLPLFRQGEDAHSLISVQAKRKGIWNHHGNRKSVIEHRFEWVSL